MQKQKLAMIRALHVGSGKSHTMGTGGTSGPAGAVPWPHAVIRNASRALFAQAATRSGSYAAQPDIQIPQAGPRPSRGSGEGPDQANNRLATAEGTHADAQQARSPEEVAALGFDVEAPRHGSCGSRRGSSDRRAGSADGSRSCPPSDHAPTQETLSEAPSLPPTAETAAPSRRQGVTHAEDGAGASATVEVHVSMWQVYKDAAQDLLAADAVPLRGRGLEGLRRVRVTSSAEVEVPGLSLEIGPYPLL